MKEWFNSLDPRERKILITGAVVLTLMSLYFLGWEPYVNKVAKLRETTAENQKTLAWMNQTAIQVKQISRGGRQVKKDVSGQSLLGLIDKTAKRNGLGTAIRRVQPDGQNKALVRLENAKFSDVVRWVEGLQRNQGIDVLSSVMEKKDEPGLVDARITFEQAG
jgi:general secretion pathway protein M